MDPRKEQTPRARASGRAHGFITRILATNARKSICAEGSVMMWLATASKAKSRLCSMGIPFSIRLADPRRQE